MLSLSVTVLHCTNWVATSQHFTILMAPTLSLFVSVSLATENCVGKSADYLSLLFAVGVDVVVAAAAVLKRHQRGEQLNLHVVSIFTIIK